MKQLRIFFAALMFLTRIPIPKWVKHQDVYLQKATKYFSLVGLLVGIIIATFYVISSYFFGNTIAIVLSMIIGIFTTGAFHEDGFADVCDAFGGGWEKEKILTIMKDSRLGTYGTAGLILILLLKFILLLELTTTSFTSFFILIELPHFLIFPIVIITAHGISRFMPLLIIQHYNYVYQEDVSKSKPLASQKLMISEIIFALFIAIIGFAFLPIYFLLSIVFMVAITYKLGNYFKKWIGGYTGDCLGTVQQVVEIIFYLSILIINKFSYFDIFN